MYENNVLMQGKPLVWLDNSSTTFKPRAVRDAVLEYYDTLTSNYHRGDYDLSYIIDKKVSEVRAKAARMIGADAREIVFTSGATMSLNLVAFGYGLTHLKEGDEIYLTEAEHASNVLPWFKVAQMTGAVIKYIPLDAKGRLTASSLQEVITPKAKIVSVAMVTNTLGYIAPCKELAKIAHEHGAIFVIDGAQAVPHLPIDVHDLDCDFLAWSGHKMCGPTGIGGLFGKFDLLMETDPYITGGGMNAQFDKCGSVSYLPVPAKFEAGTQNIEGILGLGAAIDYLSSLGFEDITRHESELKKYAVEALKRTGNATIYNADSESGILAFNINGVFAQDAATFLNSRGIACRSGQHCAKLLKGFLGTPATVRASFYIYTTKEDIDALADAVKHGEEFLDAYF